MAEAKRKKETKVVDGKKFCRFEGDRFWVEVK